MVIKDYVYYNNYYNQLNIFYNKNINLLTLTQKCKICDELEHLKSKLNIN